MLEIDGWSFTPKDPGLFGISATVEPEKEAAAREAIAAEVAAWLREPFTPAELEKARRSMLVSELGALQTASGQASSYASGEFYAGNPALFGVLPGRDRTRDGGAAARRGGPLTCSPIAAPRWCWRPRGHHPAATNAADRVELNLQRVILSNGVPAADRAAGPPPALRLRHGGP